MPMPGPVMAMLGGVSKIARTHLARSRISTTQRLTPGTQSLPPIHPPDRKRLELDPALLGIKRRRLGPVHPPWASCSSSSSTEWSPLRTT
jgi:hypothetical protein